MTRRPLFAFRVAVAFARTLAVFATSWACAWAGFVAMFLVADSLGIIHSTVFNADLFVGALALSCVGAATIWALLKIEGSLG